MSATTGRHISLSEHHCVLGGFRYDNAEIRDNLLGGIVASKDDRVSPRGGLVWRPVSWLSLYGSYTENFGASNDQQADGTFLPSQTAQQWEAGLKTEFWDGRLTGTFAYFDLTRQNLRTPDPTNPVRTLLIGEAQSRGVEFDVAGELLPGWNVIAAYAYTPIRLYAFRRSDSRQRKFISEGWNPIPRHSRT